MRSQVQRTVANCFAVLRQLLSIQRPIPSSVLQTLIVTRLDYCNAMLADIPATLLNHLQSVLDASARSIAGLRRSDHITATLASFHWLRVPERIQFNPLTADPVKALHFAILV